MITLPKNTTATGVIVESNNTPKMPIVDVCKGDECKYYEYSQHTYNELFSYNYICTFHNVRIKHQPGRRLCCSVETGDRYVEVVAHVPKGETVWVCSDFEKRTNV